MQKFQNNIQDQFGNEVTGATITVRNVVGGALSTLFSDDGVSSLANPFIAQEGSEFFFYAANLRYDIFITGPVTDSFLDVILFDPVGTPATIPIDLLDNEQIRFGTGQDTLMFFDGTDFIIQAVAGNLLLQGDIFGTGSLYLTEKSAAGADTATLGQFWVRDDAPNTPMFTDDVGTDFILNAAGTLQAVVAAGNTTNNDIEIITGAALTIFDAADVDSVSMEINTTTMAPAEAFVFLESANIEVYSFNEPINIDNGGIHIGGVGQGLEFWRFGDAVSGSISKETDGIFIQAIGGILRIQADAVAMLEVASAPADVAGRGQWWVGDEAPNVPMFTSDTGIDILIDPGISEVNEQNGNYTFVLQDKGRTVRKASGGAGETYTIPANGVTPFRIGTMIAIDNDGGGTLTLAITTDTLINGDDNTAGSITIGDGGGVIIKKVAATVWKAQGSQMT